MSSEKHEEIREKLLQIGEALGYESRSSFRKDAMGDAIWLDRKGKRFAGRSLPTVAFEVLTFETAREIRDCIMTLQIIGPALGILVIVEEEYARRAQELVNYDAETYPEHIKEVAEELCSGAKLFSRIEVWDQEKVEQLYRKHVEERLQFYTPHAR